MCASRPLPGMSSTANVTLTNMVVAEESVTTLAQYCHCCPTSPRPTRWARWRASRSQLRLPITVRRHRHQHGGHGGGCHGLGPVLSITVRRHRGQHGSHGGERHGLGVVRQVRSDITVIDTGGHGGGRRGLDSALSVTVNFTLTGTEATVGSVSALAQVVSYCPTSPGPARKSRTKASRPGLGVSITVRRHRDQHGGHG